jgi:NadR type nicotinamide-nucleotide adenylyltransferase
VIPLDDAPEDAHRHFVARLMLDLFGGPVQAVFTSEHYGDGFAAVMAQVFGAPVQHVCVDLPRAQIPVSGTQVRRDPLAHRHLLSPEVYADFMPRIALLGGESTGKSTLAQALADALGTVWVPEYGRTLWEQQDGQLSFDDMVRIGRTQVAHEVERAQQAQGCLICDTTPLTTRLYSEWIFNRIDPALTALAERPYLLTLLCDTDVPFEQDGTRQTEAFRQMQQARYVQELTSRGLPFVRVSGSVQERVAQAVSAVRAALRP